MLPCTEHVELLRLLTERPIRFVGGRPARQPHTCEIHRVPRVPPWRLERTQCQPPSVFYGPTLHRSLPERPGRMPRRHPVCTRLSGDRADPPAPNSALAPLLLHSAGRQCLSPDHCDQTRHKSAVLAVYWQKPLAPDSAEPLPAQTHRPAPAPPLADAHMRV